jgi:hypothetical protein
MLFVIHIVKERAQGRKLSISRSRIIIPLAAHEREEVYYELSAHAIYVIDSYTAYINLLEFVEREIVTVLHHNVVAEKGAQIRKILADGFLTIARDNL